MCRILTGKKLAYILVLDSKPERIINYYGPFKYRNRFFWLYYVASN